MHMYNASTIDYHHLSTLTQTTTRHALWTLEKDVFHDLAVEGKNVKLKKRYGTLVHTNYHPYCMMNTGKVSVSWPWRGRLEGQGKQEACRPDSSAI